MSGGQPGGGLGRAVALTTAVEGEFAQEAKILSGIHLHGCLLHLRWLSRAPLRAPASQQSGFVSHILTRKPWRGFLSFRSLRFGVCWSGSQVGLQFVMLFCQRWGGS
jgi:hypothetical protein